MYSTNGDFGQVRLATFLPQAQNTELFSLESVGWHCCNDRYHISWPQGASRHLLLFTVKGEGHLQVDGETFSLKPGTVALAPRALPRYYCTPPGGLWEFYWVHPTGIAEYFVDRAAHNGKRVAAFAPEAVCRQRLEDLLALCTERPPHFDWELSRQLSELVHQAAACLRGTATPESLPRRAAACLERRYAEKLVLEDAAQELFVSKAHLIRVFRQEMGCTPHQYLMQYRLMKAAQMLQFSAARIDEIAAQTGFATSSHLISCFGKAYGCTPVQYRCRSGR